MTGDTMNKKIRQWARLCGKVGFISHGLIYITVALMAFHVFSGSGERSTDFIGVLDELVGSPTGKVYIFLLSVGFFGFALWRIVQVIWDTEENGKNVQGVAVRTLLGIIGVGYGWLGYNVFSLLLQGGATSGDQTTEFTVARLMGSPLGLWLIGFAASVVAAGSLYQFFQAVTARFKVTLRRERFKNRSWKIYILMGRIGLIARGVLFGVLSFLFFWALFTYDPQKAGSQGDVFSALAEAPYGYWFIMAEALGLLIYGVFAAGQARFRYLLMDEKGT